MSDLISRQRVIKEIDRFIPVDPMMSDYTQGISVGLAIATRCIEEFSQENAESSQGLVKDLISRKKALDVIRTLQTYKLFEGDDMILVDKADVQTELMMLPSAEPERKKGKWIDETFKPWGLVYHPYKCDQCGEHSEADSNFCPNCGADMRVGEEE